MSEMVRIYETLIEKSIEDWGRNINIVYGSTSNCSSCAYNPVSKEATNATCSTCDGKFFFQSENNLAIKGVLKTFIGDMKFRDYALHRFGYVPDFDARITCWLPDILINDASASGPSYLDVGKSVRVEVDGKKYNVVNSYRTGIEYSKVMIASLVEIK